MLVMILAFGITVVSCDDGGDDNNNNNGTDTWSNVTSWSQVNGNWKAQSSVTFNMQGKTVTQNYSNYIITYNATAKTRITSGSCTAIYSNVNQEEWSSIKSNAQSLQQDGITITFNDANHSYTTTYNNFSQTLSENFFTGSAYYQINQNGSKLKTVVSEMGYEIIYTKQ
jgi:hypothetical protein